MSESFEIPFSVLQMQACKSILRIYETGHPLGDPAKLVVLEDGGGITYGETQATENGGNLWEILYTYYANEPGAKFVQEFAPYRDLLYSHKGPGKKDALTNSQDFKDLLVKAAREDAAMPIAQSKAFHVEYFRPALRIADAFDVTLALGLLQIYDMCIQSGPKRAEEQVEDFNNNWKEPESLTEESTDAEWEQAWVKGLVEYRHNWLSTFTGRYKGHTDAVRLSRYRTASTLELVKNEDWDLSLPMDFVMKRSEIGYKDRTFHLTAELLSGVR